MIKSRRRYNDHKQTLLAEDPYCYRCGVEHGIGGESLHYHHTIPQHTGNTDHSLGCLLCSSCHAIIHAIERRLHKVVDDDGYTHGTFAGQPRSKQQRRRSRAEQLTEAWT